MCAYTYSKVIVLEYKKYVFLLCKNLTFNANTYLSWCNNNGPHLGVNVIRVFLKNTLKSNLTSEEADKVISENNVCLSAEFSGGEFHSGSLRRGRPIRSDQHRQTLRPTTLLPVSAIYGEKHITVINNWTGTKDRYDEMVVVTE